MHVNRQRDETTPYPKTPMPWTTRPKVQQYRIIFAGTFQLYLILGTEMMRGLNRKLHLMWLNGKLNDYSIEHSKKYVDIDLSQTQYIRNIFFLEMNVLVICIKNMKKDILLYKYNIAKVSKYFALNMEIFFTFSIQNWWIEFTIGHTPFIKNIWNNYFPIKYGKKKYERLYFLFKMEHYSFTTVL